VRLITADINPAHLVTSSLLSDAFFQVPRADEDGFASAIVDIIRREKVDCYIPLLNAEIERAHEFASDIVGVDVWSSAVAASLCANKVRSAEWLTDIGVPVPRTYPAGTWSSAQNYFVKPIDGFGSRSAGVMTGEQLTAVAEIERPGLIVQDVCEPPEITIDSFFDADRGFGRAIMRERIETKAGVCTKARVFEDELLAEYARKIGEASGQRGTICFQAMRTQDGWAVTDLNFRPGAGTALTCAAGVDVLAAAFACRWGEDYKTFLAQPLPEQGLFVTRQYSEFVMWRP
jgi:hypothetical protein